MTMYFLSVAIFFLVFSTIGNFWKNYKKQTNDYWHLHEGAEILYWAILIIGSFLWFIALPLSIIGVLVYLLNMCTNKLAQYIIRLINKRNKQSK